MNLVIFLVIAASGLTPPPVAVPRASSGSAAFTVNSTEQTIETFPYPTRRKLTTLTWNASTPLLAYVLEDDGERLEGRYEIGIAPKQCSGRLGPLTFDFPQKLMFGPELFLSSACESAIPKAQRRALRTKIKDAQRKFAPAFAQFRAATRLQHGSSERRCEVFGMGYHGPICERYSGEKK